MVDGSIRTAGGATSFGARHAWKGLAAIGGIVGFFGLTDITGGASSLAQGETVLMHSLTGMSWQELQAADPAAAHLVEWQMRAGGATLLALGVLVVLVCAYGLRRRERWAWYALWILPGWMAAAAVIVRGAVDHPGYGTPVPVISGSILGVLSVVLLALARPRRSGITGP